MDKPNLPSKFPWVVFRPLLLSALTGAAVALLVVLGSWGFILRSIVKWFLQAAIIAVPLTLLLYFLFFRKVQAWLRWDLRMVLAGFIFSALMGSQLVPAQLTPVRTVLVSMLVLLFSFIVFALLLQIHMHYPAFPMHRVLVFFILLCSLAGMALVFSNSLNARLYSDDFCYAVNYDQLGFPGAALFFYNDWSGRIFSNFFVMGLTDQPRTILYLITLTTMSLFISLLFTENGAIGKKNWLSSAALALYAMLTISIAAPDFYKSFFWICSALILFPVFIIAPIHLLLMVRLIQGRTKRPVVAIIFSALLSFSLATTHEAATLGWLALNGIGLLWTFFKARNRKQLQIFFLVACLATLVGLGVLLASPGVKNRSQIQQYPGSTPLLQTIPIMFKNFFEILRNIATPYYSFEMDGRPGWLFLLGMFGLGRVIGLPVKRKWLIALVVFSVTALMILAASFPAAYVYRGNIPLRTQMIPVFFLTLGLFIGGSLIPQINKPEFGFAISLCIITAVLLGMRAVIPQQLAIQEPLQQYARDWDARDVHFSVSTALPPRIDVPWDEYEQNINCVELYYDHITSLDSIGK